MDKAPEPTEGVIHQPCVQPRRLRVLLAGNFMATATSSYFAGAFRRGHDVLTIGPTFEAAAAPGLIRHFQAMAFVRPGSPERYADLLTRLSRPADIPLSRSDSSDQNLLTGEQILARLPAGWRPDLFIWVDCHFDVLPINLAPLGCPTACLMGDTHTGGLDWRVKFARHYHHVFVTFNRQHVPRFLPGLVHWLPAACDPEVHGLIASGKACDVGFVGSTYREWHADRVALLEQLVAAGIDLVADCQLLEDMALLHSRSRIVFNKSLAGDLNMRVFEALASGSLLLTDHLAPEAGLELLFRDREHLALYTPQDLVDLVRYYLAHPDEREAIAARGRAEVLAKHTYAHRADAIVEAVFGRHAAGIARCAPGSNPSPDPSPTQGGEPR